MKTDDYFLVYFDLFLKQVSFIEAAGVLVKIGLSLLPISTVRKFNKLMLVQIPESLCIIEDNKGFKCYHTLLL